MCVRACVRVCVCVCVCVCIWKNDDSICRQRKTNEDRNEEATWISKYWSKRGTKIPGWQNDHVQHTRVSLFSVYGYPQAHERRNQVLRSWIVRKRNGEREQREQKRKRERTNGEGPEVYDVESCLRSLIESCLSVCMFVPRRWPMPSSPLLHWRHRQPILGGPGTRDPAECRNRATKTIPRVNSIFSRNLHGTCKIIVTISIWITNNYGRVNYGQ